LSSAVAAAALAAAARSVKFGPGSGAGLMAVTGLDSGVLIVR